MASSRLAARRSLPKGSSNPGCDGPPTVLPAYSRCAANKPAAPGTTAANAFTPTSGPPNPTYKSVAHPWSIECVNREVEQFLHAEDPQSWKGKGPERAASLSLWLYAAIWTWYIASFGTTVTWVTRPLYQKKATPSFLDALAQLRRCLWSDRISAMSSSGSLNPKMTDGLLDVLTRAA